MDAIERNLERYLDIEGLLAAFFASFDFCLKQCILPKQAENGGRPVAACCQDRYHTLFDLDHEAYDRLRRERERRYGAPADHSRPHSVSPCEYHDSRTGCILKTHKSPVCLAFFCRRGIERLRTQYGIYFYDYLGMLYALEWILTGVFSDKDYLELKANIIEATMKMDAASRQLSAVCHHG